jgi:hypothetical protein
MTHAKSVPDPQPSASHAQVFLFERTDRRCTELAVAAMQIIWRRNNRAADRSLSFQRALFISLDVPSFEGSTCILFGMDDSGEKVTSCENVDEKPWKLKTDQLRILVLMWV